METQNVRFTLKGQPIHLKTSGDPEKVKYVMQLANDRIKNIEKKNSNAAPHLVALLALLELAEEYVEAKNRALDHGKKLREKAHLLFKMVEAETK